MPTHGTYATTPTVGEHVALRAGFDSPNIHKGLTAKLEDCLALDTYGTVANRT